MSSLLNKSFESNILVIPLPPALNETLLIISPYWYLDRHSTSAPEWSSKGVDRDPTHLAQSMRADHFLESLCNIVATFRSSRGVIDAVIMLSQFDELLLLETGFLIEAKELYPHVNLVIASVPNSCESSLEAGCVQFGSNLLNPRPPSSSSVLAALNDVILGSRQTLIAQQVHEAKHKYIAHISSHVLLPDPLQCNNAYWLSDAIQSMTSDIRDSEVDGLVSVVGIKLLTIEEYRILNYGYEFVKHPYVGGVDAMLVPRDRLRYDNFNRGINSFL